MPTNAPAASWGVWHTVRQHAAAGVSSAWFMRELPTFLDWFKRIQDAGGLGPNVLLFLIGRKTWKAQPKTS